MDIEAEKKKVLEGAVLLGKAFEKLSEVKAFISIGEAGGTPYIHLANNKLTRIPYSKMFPDFEVREIVDIREAFVTYAGVDIISILGRRENED